jgi:hypothetical protein
MNIPYKLNTIKSAVVLGVLAAAVAAGGFGLYVRESNTASQTVPAATATPAQSAHADQLTYIGEPDVSVLDQLKRIAKVETKQSSYGTLVNSINGVVNGTDGKYWLFYVDGQMADRGADAYVTKGGETIEWKFSK